VDEVLHRLDPAGDIEIVHVTDEDEYFPPPPELRDLLRITALAASLLVGAGADGSVPTATDRTVAAATVLRPGGPVPPPDLAVANAS
jgi:4-hydroxy-3-methylbut-2-enyl diphosphate reductase